MSVSFNCSVVNDTNILDTFSVDIGKVNNEIISKLGNNQYDLKGFKVDHLKRYICDRKNVADSEMKLWKVNVKKQEIKDKNISTKEDIVQKLHGEEMESNILFKNCFKNEWDQADDEFVESIHIITIVTDAVVWNNVDSVYRWIKELKRPNGPNGNPKPKLVSSFGAEFPLQGRDETLKILFNGNKVALRNGICQRIGFIKNSRYDKQDHHIPILANGPGTGKSRFLQELPTLIEDQARKYIDMKGLKMFFINVTFNGNTCALERDASAGPASVALRILYEHFLSGGTMSYNLFFSMCNENWREFTISNALEVVIKDTGNDINFVIFGIDELNCLHSLAKGDLNPVQEIVRAVGMLNCSQGNIFYAPILAGTIQGPLEDMINESKFDLLRLPLRLLSDSEVENITSYMKRDRELPDYIDHNKTFQRFISDIGGQVRALEIFYKELLLEIKMNTQNIDYKSVFRLVNQQLKRKYPFKYFVTIMKPVVAHAILNIPVDEADEFEIGNDKFSYVDLSSKGIINLEATHDDPYKFYVRMPYMWVWITTSIKDFKAGQFWDVMIDHGSHILWQSFEEFNMRFWVLRLQLLKELDETVTLRDLFRGAYCIDEGNSLLDHKFQLPTVKEYYSELTCKYPGKMQNEHLSLGTVFKNGVGAPWDIFLFLDDYLIAIQVKSSNATAGQPQVLSKATVEREYNKVKGAFEVMKKSFESESLIKHWVLFICTNGPKTKTCLDSLERNCFVIDRENFKDFYGYTFSTRAGFAADNDQLDANTAKEYELRTISGIGKAIASAIENKRPFKNKNELYDKVKNIPIEARKKIKVTKNE